MRPLLPILCFLCLSFPPSPPTLRWRNNGFTYINTLNLVSVSGLPLWAVAACLDTFFCRGLSSRGFAMLSFQGPPVTQVTKKVKHRDSSYEAILNWFLCAPDWENLRKYTGWSRRVGIWILSRKFGHDADLRFDLGRDLQGQVYFFEWDTLFLTMYYESSWNFALKNMHHDIWIKTHSKVMKRSKNQRNIIFYGKLLRNNGFNERNNQNKSWMSLSEESHGDLEIDLDDKRPHTFGSPCNWIMQIQVLSFFNVNTSFVCDKWRHILTHPGYFFWIQLELQWQSLFK